MVLREPVVYVRSYFPFDPKGYEPEGGRFLVSGMVEKAAREAADRLYQQGFPPLPELAVKDYRVYSPGEWFFRGIVPAKEEDTVLRLRLYHPPLYRFMTSERCFSLSAQGRLWGWKRFLSWDLSEKPWVAFPMDSIALCWFGTEILENELLPALLKLGVSD